MSTPQQGTSLEPLHGILFKALTVDEAAMVLGGMVDPAAGTGGVMATYDSNGNLVSPKELMTEAAS